MKWFALILLVGCSASQQIATSATEIQKLATSIKSASRMIESDSVDPFAVDNAKFITERADEIILEVGDIHASIPKVADITPWWATLLKFGFIMVATIALVFVLVQSGLLTALRVLLGWIPRKTNNEAQIALNALDPEKSDNLTTLIAARRASDPLFDSAWKKAQRKKKELVQ